MKRRRVDREKIERADRESRLVLEAERQAREAKTARLKEQRLLTASAVPEPPDPFPVDRARSRQKPARKVIEVG